MCAKFHYSRGIFLFIITILWVNLYGTLTLIKLALYYVYPKTKVRNITSVVRRLSLLYILRTFNMNSCIILNISVNEIISLRIKII